MKILITGTGRGLGKFLYSKFNKSNVIVDQFNRSTTIQECINKLNNAVDQSYDMIIHCAANVSHLTWKDEIPFSYFNDNIFLTRDILSIPHKRFVYISSIAAIEGTHKMFNHETSPYGVSKKISESIVKKFAKDFQIIRPTGLLGKEMKKNTFQKILHNEPIALTSNSIMNYVLYDDVLDVINSNTRGTITISATDSITMQEVAKIIGHNIKFGDIYFDIKVDTSETILNRSSKDSIKEYIRKYEK